MQKKKFTPPALHNLARSLWDTPEEVKQALILSYLSHPPFSYKLLSEIVRQALLGNWSKAALESAVKAHQKNEKYQSLFLKIVPLIHEHFGSIKPQFVSEVAPQKYLINDIEIPFKPPFAFKTDGKLIIPWFIFWQKNPLTQKQKSLLATMISELISQDPDYADATILIYDFSIDAGSSFRTLKITDIANIPKLLPEERDVTLLAFIEGYALAIEEIKRMPATQRKAQRPSKSDPANRDLFDPPSKD